MTDDQLHNRVEGLEEELAKLRGELGRAVEALRESVSEDADEGIPKGDESIGAGPFGADAGERAGAARDKLESEVESAVKVSKRVLNELEVAAHRHPVGSIVVAFLGGLLIARILGLGRRN
jgi:hypothetical protein